MQRPQLQRLVAVNRNGASFGGNVTLLPGGIDRRAILGCFVLGLALKHARSPLPEPRLVLERCKFVGACGGGDRFKDIIGVSACSLSCSGRLT